jgi:transcriptional regulator with XRE-family HTH domain
MQKTISADSYGEQLRYWRKFRGINQSGLALDCDTSSRHLSCVETERAQPSRHLLLRLCAALDIPLRARNSILISAGYAPLYHETGLSDPEMAQAKELLTNILKSNEPYPTMLLDGNMDIVMRNPYFDLLFRAFSDRPEMLDEEQPNLLLLLFREGGFRAYINNLPYVFQVMVERARRSLLTGAPGNRLREVLREVAQLAPEDMPGQEPPLAQIIMPLQLSRDGLALELSTTSATLGSNLNITLQELFIETAYPLGDDSTRAYEQFCKAHQGK